MIGRRVHPHRALPGVDQPDLPCAGLEVLSQLSLDLGLGVALAQNLDGQVGGKIGDRPAGTLAPWQPLPGSERDVGNVDLT
jgi:hypothetical protein